MTDPHPIFNFPTVNASDSTESALTSPAISISSASNGRYETSNPPHVPADASGTNTAYATNPPPEPDSTFFNHSSGHPSIVIQDPQNLQYLAQDAITTTTATTIPTQSRSASLFGSFGSQTWQPPPGPYLDFAPQPVYEPTGELANEHVQSFPEFDSPSSIRSSASQPLGGGATGTITSPQAAVNLNGNSGSATLFIQPPLPKSVLKRKAEHDLTSSTDIGTSKGQQSLESGGPKRRSVSFERMSAPTSRSPGDVSSVPPELQTGQRTSHSGPASAARGRARQSSSSTTPRAGAHVPSGGVPAQSRPGRSSPPSYFTQFFEEQLRQNEESGGVRTLYIDRDPSTFRDVARHLQGYYVRPVDGSHFVKLFADAQFYSLPRLIDQLFESEIFIQIGERHFQIPKDIFSDPGNSPNFFSLGFAVFFSTPGEVFPGLDRRGLLRPPSITPPNVPGRSSEIFAELLHLLRGYPVHIRNEEHRAELLRDCRYFHLRGLEQRIIAHEISYNLERQKSEICIRLEDVKPSGVSFVGDDTTTTTQANLASGWVFYARPFVDDTSYELVVEIGGETTVVDLNDMRADFHGLTKARVSSLFQVVANKMNLPTNAPLGLMMLSGGRSSQSASPGHTPLSEDRVKVRIDHSTDIVLNGAPFAVDWDSSLGRTMLYGPQAGEDPSDSDAMSEGSSAQQSQPSSARGKQRVQPQHGAKAGQGGPNLAIPPLQTSNLPTSTKRKRSDSEEDFGEWIIRSGQWRLRVQPNPQEAIRGDLEIVFMGVKIDAYSSEKARNARRKFLG